MGAFVYVYRKEEVSCDHLVVLMELPMCVPGAEDDWAAGPGRLQCPVMEPAEPPAYAQDTRSAHPVRSGGCGCLSQSPWGCIESSGS